MQGDKKHHALAAATSVEPQKAAMVNGDKGQQATAAQPAPSST